MYDEDDFQKALDAEPDNHTLRLVFADFLDEQDPPDPRGPGYRALGELRRTFGRSHWGMFVWLVVQDYTTDFTLEACARALPSDWFYLFGRWQNHGSRRAAEDEAASNFAKLPPDRQAELLGQPVEAMA